MTAHPTDLHKTVKYPLNERWRMLREIMKDPALSGSAKSVAFSMLDHLNKYDGSCFPSGETIATQLGLDRSTVVRAIGELRESGWVRTEKPKGRSLWYFFAWDRLDPPGSPAADPIDPDFVEETVERVAKRNRSGARPVANCNSNLLQTATLTKDSLTSESPDSLPLCDASRPPTPESQGSPAAHPSPAKGQVGEAERPPVDPITDEIFRLQMPVLAQMAGCTHKIARGRIAGLLKGITERSRVRDALAETIKAVPSGSPFDYAQKILHPPSKALSQREQIDQLAETLTHLPEYLRKAEAYTRITGHYSLCP